MFQAITESRWLDSSRIGNKNYQYIYNRKNNQEK